MKSTKISCAIIDCRPKERFAQGHFTNAAQFDWPALRQQLFLLPDKHIPLKVVSDRHLREPVCEFLQSKGYAVVEWLDAALLVERGFPLEKGEQSYRLWRPCETVAEAAQHMILAGKKVLDIGCGAGRDAVYLASLGAEVTAIDYIPDMAQRIAALASTESVNVEFLCENLETQENILSAKSVKDWHQHFDMIVVVRYLNRSLFPVIQRLLAEGGILVWHTFMQGCERYGSPKNPNFLLAENELANHFSTFSIIKNDKCLLADGRPVNAFIARK